MLAPEIATVGELGLPALSFSNWYGLFAPKGTPKDMIGKLNGAAVEAPADPAVRSRLADLGYDIFPRERQKQPSRSALVCLLPPAADITQLHQSNHLCHRCNGVRRTICEATGRCRTAA
jgi:hypothetical protein